MTLHKNVSKNIVAAKMGFKYMSDFSIHYKEIYEHQRYSIGKLRTIN